MIKAKAGSFTVGGNKKRGLGRVFLLSFKINELKFSY